MPPALNALSAPPDDGPCAPRPAANDEPSRLDRQRRDLILRAVPAGFGVSQRAMLLAGRARADARAVLARQCAMYLMHVVFSMPLTLVAALFRKDRTTVAHACQRIEERREAPVFDAFLHDLELAVSALDSAIQLRTKHEHKRERQDDTPRRDFLQGEGEPW